MRIAVVNETSAADKNADILAALDGRGHEVINAGMVKTGARLVRHARYAVFQFAEAALPLAVFAGILDLINGLRGPPVEAAFS